MSATERQASLDRRANALEGFRNKCAVHADRFSGIWENVRRIEVEMASLRAGRGLPGPTLANIRRACEFREPDGSGQVWWWAGTKDGRWLRMDGPSPAWTFDREDRWVFTTSYEAAEMATLIFFGSKVVIGWSERSDNNIVVSRERGPISDRMANEKAWELMQNRRAWP